MLFERRLQAGLTDGTIRLAFRRWRRAQVVAGRQYRSPIGMINVLDVSIVHGEIPAADAAAAGYASIHDLLQDLKGPDDASLYRLELRRAATPDPRSVLADEALLDAAEFSGQVQRRLDRLDTLNGQAWTLATLESIEAARHASRRPVRGPRLV